MSSHSNLDDLKEELSSLAEHIGRVLGTELDYSVDSIQKVEHILASIHTEYLRTGSEDGLQGVALEFGAYIVKVIERHFGPADWQRDDPIFGKDSFPLTWQGTTVYPYSWCLKRILDGPGDDVWSKFQVIIINHAFM